MESILMSWLAELLGWGWVAKVAIPQWAIFTLAGMVAASLAALAVRREGLGLRFGAEIIAASLVGGAFFGHLIAVAFHPDKLMADPWRAVILFRGGISSFGVYGGAIVGAWLWALRRGRSLWPHADAMAPGVLLAAAVARMGCLLKGCDFGALAPQLPWAIRYARGTPAFKHLTAHEMVDPYRAVGLPMHPFPLYEAVPVALLGLALWAWPGLMGRAPGQRACACAALYCATRAVAEHFRAVPVDVVAGVSLMQILCVGSAALFAALWWRMGHANPSRTEENHALAY